MRARSKMGLRAVLAATALLAVACGSDDDTTGTHAATNAPSTGDTTAASTPAPDGTSASGPDRTGQTIKVGLVNMDAGPYAFPEFRVGAQLAIDQINASGGINGAKLDVVSCSTDLTPESSIDCANQLVEANVALAYTAIDLASDAALPVYQEAGIPYITTNNWGSAQSNADGSYLLHTASDAFAMGAFALAEQLGITKVAVVYEQSPSAEDFANNVVVPLGQQLGVELQVIPVDAAAPDWTAAVATAKAGGAGMIWGQLSEGGCIGEVSAARAANFEGAVVAGACNAFMAELGDDSVGIYTLLGSHMPSTKASAPAEIAQRLDDYVAAMDAAGESKYAEGYATWPFSAWMELRSVLEAVPGDITPASIEAQLAEHVAIPGWFGPDLHCADAPWPSSKSNCTATLGVFQTEQADDGSLVRTNVIDFFDAYARSQA